MPWSKLGKEPVVVLLDRIFVLAEPQTNVEFSGDDTAQEDKRRKIKVICKPDQCADLTIFVFQNCSKVPFTVGN